MRVLLLLAIAVNVTAVADDRPTMASVLAATSDSDWRRPDPANTMYVEMMHGRVVFELAPDFAPAHVANIRQLVNDRYFDGLAVVRSQDNYVAQWGDPDADSEPRSLGSAAAALAPEFYRDADGLPFTRVESLDAYADEVGFSAGFPAGRDGDGSRAWLLHCYGMLGVGRGNAADSGNGASLFVVTGHAPRHLDRNITLVGRVIDGIEYLTTLPRGTGPLGFYESADQHVPILRVRMGDQLPVDERLQIEILRTDTDTFGDLVEARRYRAEDWFIDKAERIGICNVPLPSRTY